MKLYDTNEEMIVSRKELIRHLYIVLITIICIMLFKNISKSVNADTFVYNWDTYQIAQSSDDAHMYLGKDIDLDFRWVYIQSMLYDTYSGFRFQNVTIYGNATVNRAILSFYVDRPIPDNTQLTIYGIMNNPTTFNTSNDMIYNKPQTTTYTNVDAGLWEMNAWNNVTVTGITREATGFGWTNGDNVGYKILSESDMYGKVVSFDGNSSLACKLYLEIFYVIPDGKDGVLVEEMDGYEIYYFNDTGWFNFTEYTFVNDGGLGTLSYVNDTRLTFNNMRNYEADYAYKYLANVYGYTRMEMKIDFYFSQLQDQSGSATGQPWGGIGFMDSVKNFDAWNTPNLFLHLDFDLTSKVKFRLEARDVSLNPYVYGETPYITTSKFVGHKFRFLWFWGGDIDKTYWSVYNMSSASYLYTSAIYNTTELPSKFDYSYAFGTGKVSATQVDRAWGYFSSKINIERYDVYNSTGDLVNTFDELDDAVEWVQNEIDTERIDLMYAPLGTYILVIVGLIGIILMPLSIILAISSIQQGDYNGLNIWFMMFFIGLSMAIAWLWG